MKIADKPHLLAIVNKFSKQKILVIGDLMLDHYLWCSVDRISPEAPVPVANIQKQEYYLGGAGNVASNLKSLGVETLVCGLVGDDHESEILTYLFSDKKILVPLLYADVDRPTTIKTRVFANNQQLIRIDKEKTAFINKSLENKIWKALLPELEKVDGVIISDYSKGLISPSLAKKIIVFCQNKGILVTADPTPASFQKLAGANIIKPNKKEAEAIAGEKFTTDYTNLDKIGQKIRRQLKADLLITLGKDGLAIVDSKSKIIPTSSQEVYNVSGAGDTVIAVLTSARCAGANFEEAALLANLAAGNVVQKLVTATCTQAELEQLVKNG